MTHPITLPSLILVEETRGLSRKRKGPEEQLSYRQCKHYLSDWDKQAAQGKGIEGGGRLEGHTAMRLLRWSKYVTGMKGILIHSNPIRTHYATLPPWAAEGSFP